MGNTLKENPNDSQIFNQYQQTRKDPKGIVLTSSLTQQTFLLKQFSFGSQQSFSHKLQQLKDQIKKGPTQYVIGPVRAEPKTYSSLCSTIYRIYVLYQYPQITLKEQIFARQREEKNFEQLQLWSILQSCTHALSQLRPILSLNSNEVFINPDGHLKILHQDLVDQNYRLMCTPGIFYAPQKMRNFTKVDTQSALRKQSIFSLGMTLLQAALLNDVAECYDYNQCVFKQTTLQLMIQSIEDKYSQQFIEILSNILEVNPNRRASIMEVQKALDLYWNQQNQTPYDSDSQHSQSLTQLTQKNNNVSQSNIEKKAKVNESLEILKEKNKIMQSQNFNFISKSQAKKSLMKQQLQIPETISNYKLQKPQINNLQTPKNAPIQNRQHLYTDPKLLQMIRKDLDDINKLKQSNYFHRFPETNSLLSSLKQHQKQDVNKFTEPTYQYMRHSQDKRWSEFKRPQLELTQTNNIQKVGVFAKKQPELIYTIEQSQGTKYQGTTLQGMKHGRGKLKFEDGAYYQGQFKNDKMDGIGTLFYQQNYPAYEGQWKQDKFHGKGVLYNQNPQQLSAGYNCINFNQIEDYWVKYQGNFEMDSKSGHGLLYLTNGQLFQGYFHDDQIEGEGVFTGIDGRQVHGVWHNNIMVQILQ